jgi:hypothetical protein
VEARCRTIRCLLHLHGLHASSLHGISVVYAFNARYRPKRVGKTLEITQKKNNMALHYSTPRIASSVGTVIVRCRTQRKLSCSAFASTLSGGFVRTTSMYHSSKSDRRSQQHHVTTLVAGVVYIRRSILNNQDFSLQSFNRIRLADFYTTSLIWVCVLSVI